MTKRQMQEIISQDDIKAEILESIRSQYKEPDAVGRELFIYWDPSLERLTYAYSNAAWSKCPQRVLLKVIQPGIGHHRSVEILEHCFWDLQGNHLCFERCKIYDFLYEVITLAIKKEANLKNVLKECKAKKIDLSVFEDHNIEEVLDICLDVIEWELSYYVEEDWERFYDFCGDTYEIQKKGA